MLRKSLALLFTATMISGCTMIPDISMPDFSAATNWIKVPGYEVPISEEKAADMAWQEFF